MRKIQELQQTTHRAVYKRLRKVYTCSCDRCPYHRHENFDGDGSGYQTWKLTTKQTRQWKFRP
jgi:hypothetical protein